MSKEVKIPVIKKRPNKSVILANAKTRGFLTEDEKTQLATLNVKNILQRINNKAMGNGLGTTQNFALQIAIAEFIVKANEILK